MQQLLKHLFRADTLEEVPRERLEDLIEEYPSFGVVRYLLSRKLGEEKASSFREETQKTNLYFSNPFWLHWLLQNQAANQPRPSVGTSPSLPAFKVAQEEIKEVEIEIKEETIIQDKNKEEQDIPGTSNGIVGTALEQANETGDLEISQDPPLPPPAELTVVDNVQPESEELIQQYPVMAEEAPRHTEPSGPSAAEPVFFLEGIIPSKTEEDAAPEPVSQPNPESVPEDKPENAEVFVPVQPEPVITQEENLPVAGNGGIIPQAPKAFNFTLSPVKDPLTDSPLVFESFHTIDYFASQGIKLRLDDNPSDRLGKQVKSFTDWLKVMRRLPQKNAEIIPDIAAESKIQAIAAHSIEGKEIVTETMAEVLAKQGMKDKAIEVYRKLSLLNPGKRAYFATKIEQLKTF